jgi:hypothetical protein
MNRYSRGWTVGGFKLIHGGHENTGKISVKADLRLQYCFSTSLDSSLSTDLGPNHDFRKPKAAFDIETLNPSTLRNQEDLPDGGTQLWLNGSSVQ